MIFCQCKIIINFLKNNLNHDFSEASQMNCFHFEIRMDYYI